MKNVNTREYWNNIFEKEYKLINEKEIINSDDGYRWEGMRFSIVGANIPCKGKFVDIGCGLGNFCRFIKARNPFLEVSGIDFSEKAIELAKKIKPDIEYKVISDIYNTNYPNNYFDIISAQEIIEHLEKPKDAIREWKRILKPNGKLFITTPWRGNGLNPNLPISDEHLQEWTPNEFGRFLIPFFSRNIKMIFPPLITDIITRVSTKPYWFLTICEK